MKKIFFSIAVLFSALTVSAQHETRPPQGQVSITPHGKVYGEKVDVKTAHPIGDMEAYLGRRTSITTTISGKVVDVDRNGDSFTIRDSKGRPVTVIFNKAGYKFPMNLRGKNVLIDGVISKQFIANNRQHYAGSNAGMEKTHQKNNNTGGYEMRARGVQLLD
jgi:hypothetical protein